MNGIKLSESFYNTRIIKAIFFSHSNNIKLFEDKIKSYIGFTPMTKDELKTAVTLWCLNKELLIKYGHISDWNVQNITDMSHMFSNYNNFNEPLNKWDVSNVTNMSNMFDNCEKFKQPLNKWNVSNVNNMYCMFMNCKNFNKLLNKWSRNKVYNLG